MTPLSPIHPARILATWFGVGHLPGPSGTWGSLVALPFAWALVGAFGARGLLIAALVVALAGILAADVYVSSSYRKDPGTIVVDEVAGQWLTLGLGALIEPLGPWAYAVGFIFFRFADIWKPWPVSWFDRNVTGGLGVMLDDIVAGVLAGVALAAILWLL